MTTTSTITFTDFNVDPLPTDLSHIVGLTSVSYGLVVGANPLDTADGDTSYVQLERSAGAGASAQVITCRPVLTPPVPHPSADVNTYPTTLTDFRAFTQQARFAFAPPVLTSTGVPNTPPSFFLTDSTAASFIANDIAEPRSSTDPAWSNSWWDETDCGQSGGLPIFPSADGLHDPSAFIDAALTGGYVVIFATTTNYFGYDSLVLLSHLSYQFEWDLNAVLKTIGENFLSVGGAQIKSLIPGVGWVPVQRHG